MFANGIPMHRATAAATLPDHHHAGVAASIRTRFDQEGIRAQVKPHHAATLLAVEALEGTVADVNAVYKKLVDDGDAAGVTQLYRALKLLVQAGLLVRHLHEQDGRARSVYALPGAAPVCAHCGVALHRAAR